MASIRSILLVSAILGAALPASLALAETPVTDGTPTKADTATPSTGPATGGGDTPYLTNGKKPDEKPASSAATPPATSAPAASEAKAPEPASKPADATPSKPVEAARPAEPATPATPAPPATAATPQPQQTTPTAIQPQPEAATPNKAAETKPTEKPKPKPEAAKKKPKPANHQASRERPVPPLVVRRDNGQDVWVEDNGPIPPRPIGPPPRRRVIVENDDGDYVVVRRPRHCETRGFLFNQRTVCY